MGDVNEVKKKGDRGSGGGSWGLNEWIIERIKLG